MRGDWESWLLDVVGAHPGGGGGEAGRTSSQPHQVHNRGLATGGKGLAVDRHLRCLGP